MASFVDWLLGQLTPTQWDAWRNWLATTGGLVALLIAANTYRRNVRIKREEQARLVYSKFIDVHHRQPGEVFTTLLNGARIGNGSTGLRHLQQQNPSTGLWDQAIAVAPLIQTTVIVHNGSKELIGPARLQMVNGGTGEVWETFSISVAEVEPESDFVVEFTWINDVAPGQPSLATTVIFRDASGQWWRRHRSEPIERVHDDPENAGLTPEERRTTREYQRSIGIPPEQQVKEPKLSIGVRLHRRLRSLRGKPTLP